MKRTAHKGGRVGYAGRPWPGGERDAGGGAGGGHALDVARGGAAHLVVERRVGVPQADPRPCGTGEQAFIRWLGEGGGVAF